MASIFSRLSSLFGGSSAPAAKPPAEHSREISGLRVIAAPLREGAQFRIAGRIEKEDNGTVLVREFIRADLFSTEEDAVDVTFRKAEQIITQSGRTLFADGAPTGRA